MIMETLIIDGVTNYVPDAGGCYAAPATSPTSGELNAFDVLMARLKALPAGATLRHNTAGDLT
jgi:hypothetical protein